MTKEKTAKADDIVAIARAAYEAYVTKDRAAIEKLIAADFHFTSPLDNQIDRATYFARCWPNSETIKGFDFINLVPDRDRVFVTYEGRDANGQRGRLVVPAHGVGIFQLGSPQMHCPRRCRVVDEDKHPVR